MKMTETGPIETLQQRQKATRHGCPVCKNNLIRLHTRRELEMFHPKRIGVDDRFIDRKWTS